jgi:hypothetical protein
VREYRAATECLGEAIDNARGLPRSDLDMMTALELEMVFRSAQCVPVRTRAVAAAELLRRISGRSGRGGLAYSVLERLVDDLESGKPTQQQAAMDWLVTGLHTLGELLEPRADPE